MEEDKIISILLMVMGMLLSIVSLTGAADLSIMTGILVFSSGSIALLLSNSKDKDK